VKAPEKIQPRRLGDYLDVMTRAVFQSGMSWRVVEAKWDGFRDAFHEFDPEWVAKLGEEDVERLTADRSIVRNRRKIEATIENAATMLELEAEHGAFRDYLRSHGRFEETAADLVRRFKYLGDTGAYYFLYVVGEEVPPHEEWAASRGVAVPTG
jgi:3-methyladenine DNA glycosylase Tag